MDGINQKTYAAFSVVQHYAQLKLLQPAEETILELFRDRWSNMKMLDLGVGGGRTTQHFASLAVEYVGIDYSAEMVAACQKRFAASPDLRVEAGDARDLSRFADNSFDFILFSFNGIDFVSHSDRLKVFQEIRRVGKPGGYFFFSSHNLQGLELEFSLRKHLSLNPITTYVNLVLFAILRLINRSFTLEQLKASSHVIVRDESHNFRLKTYYIRPEAQIQQLAPNFSEVKVYSWKTGLQITSEAELRSNSDMWLYYLCVIQ
ncbi:class I SAM-dependent methyltransferase [Trichocoleus sp. FACHB-262]|uniref:class I SAM-dependent methyltransferase n=1 Tax=Trichocoleus sp. FACHB-262 TaxID=2692869 RepID=UPI00168764BD|nr:class I SAM-dependent methyltransferase [Trichocoleus sp. FACHB-262]MBD2119389.1 class I SAM-dependent methyltransferase [Trichocoleus sp. FACHB-262]